MRQISDFCPVFINLPSVAASAWQQELVLPRSDGHLTPSACHRHHTPVLREVSPSTRPHLGVPPTDSSNCCILPPAPGPPPWHPWEQKVCPSGLIHLSFVNEIPSGGSSVTQGGQLIPGAINYQIGISLHFYRGFINLWLPPLRGKDTIEVITVNHRDKHQDWQCWNKRRSLVVYKEFIVLPFFGKTQLCPSHASEH